MITGKGERADDQYHRECVGLLALLYRSGRRLKDQEVHCYHPRGSEGKIWIMLHFFPMFIITLIGTVHLFRS